MEGAGDVPDPPPTPTHMREDSGLLTREQDWQDVSLLVNRTPRGTKPQDEAPLKEGWLSKKGLIYTGWKTRYFVCLPHKLQYFKTAKYADLEPLGEIMLTPHTIVGVDKTATKTVKHILSIMSAQGSRRFLLECKDEQDMNSWLDVLLTRVADLIQNQSNIDTLREKGLAKLAQQGRSIACREVYELVQMMQFVTPFSTGCEQLWQLARRLEEEGPEDTLLSHILMQFYAIFQSRKAGVTVRALECRCDRGKERCPIVVFRAFAFNKGSEVLLRLWMHLVAPTRSTEPAGVTEEDIGHPVPEWIIRVLWVVSELEAFDLFSKCSADLFIDTATRVHVEDVIENSEKQTLFTIRVNVGHQVWYVERQFSELRAFGDELAKTFKENKYVKAFPASKIGPVDRASNIKRLHQLNEYFQVLQGKETWSTAVMLPAFSKFFDITSNLRLSRTGENTWSKFVKAIQVGSQIGQPRVMARTAVTLFEIMLGLLPSPREDKVKTWFVDQISRYCFNAPPIASPTMLPLILRVLQRCSLSFVVTSLECVHLLVASPENCVKLTGSDEGWPKWFLPFLSDAYVPPRLPATQQCRNAAVGFNGTVRVEIAIKCRNLIKMDTLSLSDPVVELYLRNKDGKLYMQPGNERTEVIDDNHNPDFLTRFFVEYNPMMIPRQELTFIVYDSDGPTLRREDRMGLVVANLHDLLWSRISRHPLQLLYVGPRWEERESGIDMGGTAVAKELNRIVSSGRPMEDEDKRPDLLTRVVSSFTQAEPPVMIIYAKPVEDHTLRVLVPSEVVVVDSDIKLKLPNLVLGNEEKVLCCASNSKDAEDYEHLIMLTSRRLMLFSSESLVVNVWREDVALVRSYLNGTQLDLATWTGETHVISVYHKTVAAFLLRVFQLDRTSAIIMREAQPGQPMLATVADMLEEGHQAAHKEEFKGTAEEKAKKEKLRVGLSLSVLAQVMYHYFTTATAVRKKVGSYSLRLFTIVNTIADEMAWNQSAFVPVILRFLHSVVALTQSRNKTYSHRYEALEWPNVFRMCGAYEKLIDYRPLWTGNPSRLSKQRRRVARNAGIPILDAAAIKLVVGFLESLRFEEMDPHVAGFAAFANKGQIEHLKQKGMKALARWNKILARLNLPAEIQQDSVRTRDRRQYNVSNPRMSGVIKVGTPGSAPSSPVVASTTPPTSAFEISRPSESDLKPLDDEGYISSDFDEDEPQEEQRKNDSFALQVSASDV